MSNPIPLSLDQPFRFDQPLDMDDARKAARAMAEARRQAREWMQRAIANAAEKERAYRLARARAWTTAEGVSKEKEDGVNAATVEERVARDVAVGIVKAAQERIEEVDAERASLHKLIEWSMRLSPVAEQHPSGEVVTFGDRRAS